MEVGKLKVRLKGVIKRPSKESILQVLGWYATRVLVVIIWCGVIWAILGSNDTLPSSTKHTTTPPVVQCLLSDELGSNNETLFNLLSYLSLPHVLDDSDDILLNSNHSFLYPCNITTPSSNHRYCLVTLAFDQKCLDTQLSFTVHLLNTLTPDDNSTILNISLEYSLTDAIQRELSSSPQRQQLQGLFDIPDGHFFALIVLVIVSGVGGMLARVVRLPPLLGMMVGGFLLRNIPVIGIAGDISSVWSSTLRNIALVIILLRGGLALDGKQLWKLKVAVPILALVPCIVEGSIDGLISIYLLDIPWRWGLMLGFILSAISPAVVVPTTLSLGEKVPGINKGITTLIVAAANIDVVIAISLFSVFLGLIFSDGSIVLDAFRAPIEITVGILYGIVCGLILWILPTSLHTKSSLSRNRFFMLFGFGLFSLFGGRRAIIGGAALSGAGALGVLVVAFVGTQKWTSENKKIVSRSFYLLWQFAQPILFGLIGAALDVTDISGALIGKAVLLICVGLVFRLTVAVFAVTGNKFTVKEKIFVAISWIPKATVQAAIGSIALDLVTADQFHTERQLELGKTVLTVSVLAIVLCAPVGAILSSVTGAWLLKHPVTSTLNENSVEGDVEGTPEEVTSDEVKIKNSNRESAV